MAAQVEVELGWMSDTNIDSRARRDVSTFANLNTQSSQYITRTRNGRSVGGRGIEGCSSCLVFLISAKQSGVMSLLDNNERDSGLVSHFQLHARLANGAQLLGKHRSELPLTDAVAIEDDASGLEASAAVEGDEELLHHRRQLLDDLLSVRLHANRCRVTTGVGVHGSNHL